MPYDLEAILAADKSRQIVTFSKLELDSIQSLMQAHECNTCHIVHHHGRKGIATYTVDTVQYKATKHGWISRQELTVYCHDMKPHLGSQCWDLIEEA